LKCPRCGAEFRPTVPWPYFHFLAVLFVLVCLGLILSLTQYSTWLIILILIFVALFLWFLPRLSRFVVIPGDLSIADGPGRGEDLQLKLYPEWSERDREGGSFPPLVYTILLLAAVLIALILFRILH
jgi:hypothetical protein